MNQSQQSPSQPLNIVIVGGSLAGLFAGVALKGLPQIASITILERLREGSLQDLGAGIRCNEEVNDAVFELLGIQPESYAAFLTVFRSFDCKGADISRVDTGTYTTTWGQLYRVLKGGFTGEIGNWKEGHGNCTYRLGCSLVGLQELKDGEVNGDANKSNAHSDARSRIQVDFDNEHGQRESMTADLVIGADGASSKARSLVLPHIQRTMAPYVCYRGVINPCDLSPSTMKLYYRAGLLSYPSHNTGQVVSYVVPGDTDKPDESTHCVNWLLYSNKSPEATRQLMTDKDGKEHHYLLPRGKMADAEIKKLYEEARETIPEVLVEVIEKTPHPFVQRVTDSLAPENCFMGGKLLLVGDAVGGQRPHAASGLMQGIFHGLYLRKLIQNEVTLENWSQQTRELTQILVESGQDIGDTLMNKIVPPKEKIAMYMKTFMRTQEDLNRIWKGVIGIGNATVKM